MKKNNTVAESSNTETNKDEKIKQLEQRIVELEQENKGKKEAEDKEEKHFEPKTLQELLDKEYPTKEDKEKVEDIGYCWEKEGEFVSAFSTKLQAQEFISEELDLTEYPNLKRIIIYDERPQEAKKLSTKLTLGKKERLIRIGCFYNKLPELDISGCPKLTLLYCENNELTSLDVSHNPYLKTFHCLDNSLTHLDVSNNPKLVELYIDYKLLDNITGLEKTSIVRLDCRGGGMWQNRNAPFIWKVFLNKYNQAFPEMKLINVDDLTEWAGQVNEETVKDEKFLAKVCPSGVGEFIKRYKNNVYWILDQITNSILARCLIIINRLYTKAKDEEYEQHLENLAKQSLKCMSMNPKYPQASLYESRAKLVQQALTPDYELLEVLADLPYISPWVKEQLKTTTNSPEQSQTDQTEINKWDKIKDDMERENNCGRLANGGYWDEQIQTLLDGKLPENKKQITLQTRRINHLNKLEKLESQTKKLNLESQITPK